MLKPPRVELPSSWSMLRVTFSLTVMLPGPTTVTMSDRPQECDWLTTHSLVRDPVPPRVLHSVLHLSKTSEGCPASALAGESATRENTATSTRAAAVAGATPPSRRRRGQDISRGSILEKTKPPCWLLAPRSPSQASKPASFRVSAPCLALAARLGALSLALASSTGSREKKN